jgi:hypothetical protein
MTLQAANMTFAGPHSCMQFSGLPADGMMAARSPIGISAHPAGSSVSILQQTQLYARAG